MMNNKNLQIGNLIKRNGLVVTVDEQTFWDIKNNPEQYEPITLREEWLLNLGFEVYDFDHKENQYRFKERLLVIRDGIFCDYGTRVKLKYVHQLQNLYSALTNEQLNPNDKQG